MLWRGSGKELGEPWSQTISPSPSNRSLFLLIILPILWPSLIFSCPELGPAAEIPFFAFVKMLKYFLDGGSRS
jgi:hypothetical protein